MARQPYCNRQGSDDYTDDNTQPQSSCPATHCGPDYLFIPTGKLEVHPLPGMSTIRTVTLMAAYLLSSRGSPPSESPLVGLMLLASRRSSLTERMLLRSFSQWAVSTRGMPF
jgi:hypothetical protein